MFNNCGLKAVSKRKYNIKGDMLEPQNLKFLNKMYHRLVLKIPIMCIHIPIVMSRSNYLFRCNKIDIK